jgi:hypothetical protein
MPDTHQQSAHAELKSSAHAMIICLTERCWQAMRGTAQEG